MTTSLDVAFTADFLGAAEFEEDLKELAREYGLQLTRSVRDTPMRRFEFRRTMQKENP